MRNTQIYIVIIVVFVLVFGQGCKGKPNSPTAESQTQESQTKASVEPEIQPSAVVAVVQPEATKVDWMTDFEAAQKKAVAEKKDLFLLFTGTDWCPACQKLEKEVLSQELFTREVQKFFVLVKLDFPRKTQLPAALEQQNERLARQYGIQYFPTIILADPAGKPYAQPQYEGNGTVGFLVQLAQARQSRQLDK